MFKNPLKRSTVQSTRYGRKTYNDNRYSTVIKNSVSGIINYRQFQLTVKKQESQVALAASR
jgi:hypothetical protein